MSSDKSYKVVAQCFNKECEHHGDIIDISPVGMQRHFKVYPVELQCVGCGHSTKTYSVEAIPQEKPSLR